MVESVIGDADPAGGRPVAPAIPDMPGEPLSQADPSRLGRYTLKSRLGEGGMGVVYLAHDELGNAVAIKVIRRVLAGDREFRARFRREVATARRVAAFCTAAVLDADPDADPPYLVTEYVEGRTLSAVVADRGPLGPAALGQLAISIATALTAIHREGVVHRDLKPSNVLLSPTGARVIDFGIARALDGTMISQDMQRLGTPAFMAPEQITGTELTPAVDIFAWGGVVVYAGTGRRPFGDTALELLPARILHAAPDLNGLVPALRQIVQAAMAKNPDDRPTAEELYQRLIGVGSFGDPHAPTARRARGPGGTPSRRPPDIKAPPVPRVGTPPVRPPSVPMSVPSDAARSTPAEDEQTLTGSATPKVGRKEGERPGRPARLNTRRPRLLAVTAGTTAAIATVAAIVLAVQPGDTSVRDRSAAAVLADRSDQSRRVDPDRALRLAVAAYRLDESTRTREVLLASTPAHFVVGHNGAVNDAGVSRDGITLATASSDGTARLWDITDPANHGALPPVGPRYNVIFSDVSFTPDNRTLAVSGSDGTVRLWDISDRRQAKPLSTITGHTSWVWDALFVREGAVLVTASADGTARLWDVTNPAKPTRLATIDPDVDWVGDATLSPDGVVLALSTRNSFQLWDITDTHRPTTLGTTAGGDSEVGDMEFSRDGRLLVTANKDGTARLWDVANRKQPVPLGTVKGHDGWVRGVAFHPDDPMLATTGDDGLVRLWDITDRNAPQPIATLAHHSGAVNDVLFFGRDGTGLITAGADNGVRIWSLDPEEIIRDACTNSATRITAEEWASLLPGVPFQSPCP